MSRKLGLSGFALAVIGLSPLVGLADESEAVQKKILNEWRKAGAVTAKFKAIVEIAQPPANSTMNLEGTYEYLRKGDQKLFRLDAHEHTVTRMGGQEFPANQDVTIWWDNTFCHSFCRMKDSQAAFKMWGTGQDKHRMDVEDLFAIFSPDFTFSLLPEKTDVVKRTYAEIDGKKVWCVQALAKNPESPIVRGLLHFSQEGGVPMRLEWFDKDNLPLQQFMASDVKINVDVDPKRFVVVIPPDVELRDKTVDKPPPPLGPAVPPARTQPVETQPAPKQP